MPDPQSPTPRRILLATDLSARGDRALDRALRLAKDWQAELVAVHVVEPAAQILLDQGDEPSWRRGVDPIDLVRYRLQRELGDVAGLIQVRIERGDPAERIAAVAREEGCGLIVTGIARDETLGRMLLGTTVDRLVRAAPVPVLVVKRRAVRGYDDILVTTDFSEAAAHALAHTAQLFPRADFTLLHGYDLPFIVSGGRQDFFEQLRGAEQQEAAEFLDRAGIDGAIRTRTRALIEHGDPVRLATRYVRDRDPDLTVVGSHGRGLLFELTIGSVARKLLQAVDSDVLVVRKAKAAG